MQPDKVVLCVDDNADHNELLEIFFKQVGYKIVACDTPESCLQYLKTIKFSAVIFGSWQEEDRFIEVLDEMKILYPNLPFVFFTADAREASRQKGLQTGAQAYLVKPNDLENIVPTIARITAAEYL